MPKFTITTLGCKVNQYDGQRLAEALRGAGFESAAAGEALGEGDLIVLNTCCVTATAMQKSRQAFGRMLRRHGSAANVLVTGCYAQHDPARIKAMLGSLGVPEHRQFCCGHHGDLRAVIGSLVGRQAASSSSSPLSLAICEPAGAPAETWPSIGSMNVASDPARQTAQTHPNSMRPQRGGRVKGTFDPEALPSLRRFAGHQRAFVKVQDGCDAFCSYCIVPYARPRVFSRSASSVLQECRALLDAGHREIVLCGVCLGAYGRSSTVRARGGGSGDELARLVSAVADLPGLWRVRLSSLEPGDLTDGLLAVLADRPTVAPHLHLPLQSGSADVLKRMNRQYTPDDYRRAVDRVRAVLDRPALTADVIVGFPGESEQDFQATLDTARYAALAGLHAFAFSPIEPTAAWRQRHLAPPPTEVRQRLARLDATRAELELAYRRQFVGQTVEALVERSSPRSKPGKALTDRYQPVRFPSDRADLTGQVVRVRISAATPEALLGDLETVGR